LAVQIKGPLGRGCFPRRRRQSLRSIPARYENTPRRIRLFSDLAEPPFHHVQAQELLVGREVHVKSRMAFEPGQHLGMLVRRVVVDDQVQIQFQPGSAGR